MIDLADTSIRLYRKKNGNVSVRLRSYLMVETNVSFSLEAYLQDISCSLTFPNGDIMEFEVISFSTQLACEYTANRMAHDFWASGEYPMKEMKNTIGKLRLDYHVSFTGHPSEEPAFKEYMIPIIKRRSVYDL